MKTILLVLCATSTYLLNELHLVLSQVNSYHRTPVMTENLTISSMNEVVTSKSLVNCAMLANSRPWCHLMCYESTLCTLYDVKIPRSHNISVSDAINNCWTNVEAVNELNCPQDFTGIVGVGCVLVNNERMNQASAKDFCTSISSRLVIPDDFAPLKEFVLAQDPLEPYYWVGIENGVWMNGRAVLDTEWGRADHGDAECAYQHEAVEHGIIGYGCNFDMPFICQLLT